MRTMLLLVKLLIWTRRKGRIPIDSLEWLAIRSIVVMRDGYKCRKCGVQAHSRHEASGMFDVDHIIPVAHGGSNHFSNLQTLCKSCHKKKHAWLG